MLMNTEFSECPDCRRYKLKVKQSKKGSLFGAPLTEAVETGFTQLRDDAQSAPALQGIADRLESLQAALVEVSSQATAAQATQTQPRPGQPDASDQTNRKDNGTGVLLATAAMLLGWVGVLWYHTGDARVALLGFVAINLVGCLALGLRRSKR